MESRLRGGICIGKVLGIEIRLDWSWFAMFALVAWSVSSAVFPDLDPPWDVLVSWGVGVSATLLFFGCVLAHELAHSLVARASGTPVRYIRLTWFGGASYLNAEPASPRAEFEMVVAGPLASIALGVLFEGLGALRLAGLGSALFDPASGYAAADPLSTVLFFLGPFNLGVGFFNLLPGFPLDGGRVLRSLIWTATKNLEQATRYAASFGEAVGWLVVFTGIAMAFGVDVPFCGTGIISGLCVALVGWLLSRAAAESYEQSLAGAPFPGPVDAHAVEAAAGSYRRRYTAVRSRSFAPARGFAALTRRVGRRSIRMTGRSRLQACKRRRSGGAGFVRTWRSRAPLTAR